MDFLACESQQVAIALRSRACCLPAGVLPTTAPKPRNATTRPIRTSNTMPTFLPPLIRFGLRAPQCTQRGAWSEYSFLQSGHVIMDRSPLWMHPEGYRDGFANSTRAGLPVSATRMNALHQRDRFGVAAFGPLFDVVAQLGCGRHQFRVVLAAIHDRHHAAGVANFPIRRAPAAAWACGPVFDAMDSHRFTIKVALARGLKHVLQWRNNGSHYYQRVGAVRARSCRTR